MYNGAFKKSIGLREKRLGEIFFRFSLPQILMFFSHFFFVLYTCAYQQIEEYGDSTRQNTQHFSQNISKFTSVYERSIMYSHSNRHLGKMSLK